MKTNPLCLFTQAIVLFCAFSSCHPQETPIEGAISGDFGDEHLKFTLHILPLILFPMPIFMLKPATRLT